MGMVLKLEAAWHAFRHAEGLDRCHGQPGRAPLPWSRIGRRTHMTQAPPPPPQDPNDPLGSPSGSVPPPAPPPAAPPPPVAPSGGYPPPAEPGGYPAPTGADAPPAGYGTAPPAPAAGGYGEQRMGYGSGAAASLPYADWPKRALGALIDFVLPGIAAVLIGRASTGLGL